MPASTPDAPQLAEAALALDVGRVRAISIDLDDTLWPIWPTIAKAEQVLLHWLTLHAPATARLFANTEALRAIRNQMVALRPDLVHDLSALRLESIRLALQQAGDEPALAEPAFDVFLTSASGWNCLTTRTTRWRFCRPATRWWPCPTATPMCTARGIGHYFKASISAKDFGVPKPDVRIFHAAAQAAQVQPHEVLHVGDDATADAQGALAAGMQAVWLNTAGHDWPHPERPHATVANLTHLCRLLG